MKCDHEFVDATNTDRGGPVVSGFVCPKCGALSVDGVTAIGYRPPQMELAPEQLELCRQWFDNVQDMNPVYLEPKDYSLAKALYEHLGMRVPHTILEKL